MSEKELKYNISRLQSGRILANYLPDFFSFEGGMAIEAFPGLKEGYVITECSDKKLPIKYSSISDLMMALGDIIAHGHPRLDSGPVVPALDFRAVMLDCSRNGVPTVDFLKGAILKLALMGMNYFCLYTEDTYEVDGEPLIGYGRGRYSKTEIRELVGFGEKIGVTLFPCIQTLGHLEQILKYHKYVYLRDNTRVLNALKEETYIFVAKLITEAVNPYNTKLIHLGMDETWGIGRGYAFVENKPIRPLEIYAKHVARVFEICEKEGLQPIMWGDFILGHSGEKEMNEFQKSFLPKSMIMNYWEYESQDKSRYAGAIAEFRKMGYEPLVSPGFHNWGRFWTDYQAVLRTAGPCMKAVHECGIKKTMMTMWGDDGQECLFDANYPALSFYLAWCRMRDPSPEFWEKRAEIICGVPFAEFLKFSEFENFAVSRLDKSGYPVSSKMLFYDDPFFGYVNRMFSDDEVYRIFSDFAETLRKAAGSSRKYPDLLRLAALYSSIISLKFQICRNSRLAYFADNKRDLKIQLGLIPNLEKDICEFHSLYKRLWLRERKPFGLEVMDIRLAGLKARTATMRETIESYLAGEQGKILEFEFETPGEISWADFQTYSKVVSRCFSLW